MDILEQFDFKLQDIFLKRLEMSRQLGESAAQPFGDILAILVSIYAAGFAGLPASERPERFEALRGTALDVINTVERLVNSDD